MILLHSLMEAIQSRKTKMLQVAFEKGLQSEETLQHSRELDSYLTLYQKLTLKSD